MFLFWSHSQNMLTKQSRWDRKCQRMTVDKWSVLCQSRKCHFILTDPVLKYLFENYTHFNCCCTCNSVESNYAYLFPKSYFGNKTQEACPFSR